MPFYKFMAKIRLEYTHTECRRKEKSPIKIAKLQESMYTQTRTHSIQKLKMTVNDFVALVKCARFQFQWMGYGRERIYVYLYLYSVHAMATISPKYPDVGLSNTHALVFTSSTTVAGSLAYINLLALNCRIHLFKYVYFLLYWRSTSPCQLLRARRATWNLQLSGKQQTNCSCQTRTKPNTKRIKASYVSICKTTKR